MTRVEEHIDPNEHCYITSFRGTMDANDGKALPDVHALMPWARARLFRQADAARRLSRAIKQNARATRVGAVKKAA